MQRPVWLVRPRLPVPYPCPRRAQGGPRVPSAGAAGGGEEPIDRLEVEAAAVVEALFGPYLAKQGYVDEVSFVDNNTSLAWICRGRARSKDGRPRLDVDLMLSGMWL